MADNRNMLFTGNNGFMLQETQKTTIQITAKSLEIALLHLLKTMVLYSSKNCKRPSQLLKGLWKPLWQRTAIHQTANGTTAIIARQQIAMQQTVLQRWLKIVQYLQCCTKPCLSWCLEIFHSLHYLQACVFQCAVKCVWVSKGVQWHIKHHLFCWQSFGQISLWGLYFALHIYRHISLRFVGDHQYIRNSYCHIVPTDWLGRKKRLCGNLVRCSCDKMTARLVI